MMRLTDAELDKLKHQFVMTMAGYLDAQSVTLGQLWDLATMLLADVEKMVGDGR